MSKPSEKVKKINKENGSKLRGFRLQNKMSQPVLGSIVGKNFRTISQYELGIHAIPEDIITKLNKEYHLKLQSTGNTHSKRAVVKPVGFSKKLATLRESLNMTIKQFASKFKMPMSTVWNLEHNISDKISAKSLNEMHKSGVDIVSLIK